MSVFLIFGNTVRPSFFLNSSVLDSFHNVICRFTSSKRTEVDAYGTLGKTVEDELIFNFNSEMLNLDLRDIS